MPWRWGGFPGALAGLVAFVVYLLTLSPSISWGDSAELTAAAWFAGVPHPTGYPLYMLLSHAFLHTLTLGTIAYRMNLLSALSAAAAVILVYALARQVTRRPAPALLSALLFAFSRTLWSQAVIAEVYAFQAVMTVAVLLCAVRWDESGDRRWLRGGTFLYGLAFTHHLTSLLLAPGLVVYVLSSRHVRQFWREFRLLLPLFLIPALLYVYIPLAAFRDPPTNWSDARNLPNFLDHVTGSQYRERMFVRGAGALWQQAVLYFGAPKGKVGGFLLREFGVAPLLLAIPGLWRLGRSRPRLLMLTVMVFLATLLYAFNYTIEDIDAYFIPSYLMIALWAGCAMRWLATLAAHRVRRSSGELGGSPLVRGVAVLPALLLPASVAAENWTVNDQHEQWEVLVSARAALDYVEPGALVMGCFDNGYFPAIYVRYVEGRRPDITLIGIFDLLLPQRIRLAKRWESPKFHVNVPEEYANAGRSPHWHNCMTYQIIQDHLDVRPVYLLGIPDYAFQMPWLRDSIIAFGISAPTNLSLFRMSRKPPPLATRGPGPQFVQYTRFGHRGTDGRWTADLEFLGYDVRPFSLQGLPWWRLRYYWRILNREQVKNAQVRAIFADDQGRYSTEADGFSDAKDFHPLGQGFRSQPIPPFLVETVDAYVSPRVWTPAPAPWLWVGVKANGQLLQTEQSPQPFVRMGQLPAAAGPKLP